MEGKDRSTVSFRLVVLLIALIMTRYLTRQIQAYEFRTSAMRVSPQFLVDMNQAPFAEILLLPHCGETLARRIAAGRSKDGNYQDIENMRLRNRLGKLFVNHIQDQICIGSDSTTPRDASNHDFNQRSTR